MYEWAKYLHERYEFYMEIHILKHSARQYLLVAYPEKVTEPGEATINISVKKSWNDSGDAYKNRPTSVTVKLYKDGSDTGKSLTLSESNGWSGTFEDLENDDGYAVKETVPTGYSVTYGGNQTDGFKITNTLKTTSVKVSKTWNDENNRDGKRPSSVKVTLYENGVATSTTATLSASNGWAYTFSNLPKYKNGSQVNYTIQETVPTGYTATYSGNGTTSVSITNTHIPEKTQVTVTKTWEDAYNGVENFDEIRPSSITMTLYGNGVKVTKDGFGNAITNPITISGTSKNWTGTFTNLYKYENGKEIVYTVKESGIPEGYQSTVSGNTTVVNTHIPHYDGYIEISGKAWLDGEGGKQNSVNGTFDKDTDPNSTDKGLQNIKVTLKDESRNTIKSTYTDENGNFTRSDYGYTDANGNYTIRVNYDNSVNAYKLYEDAATIEAKIKTAYVEFEYNGMLYTTVAPKTGEGTENTSKVKENEDERFNNGDIIAKNYPTITKDTPHADEWKNTEVTASTQGVIEFDDTYKHITNGTSKENIKYCDGNGNYVRTKYNDSTKVETGKHTCANCEGTGHSKEEWQYEVEVMKIQNVNIGLFKREQPDVAIFSDIKKVEVEMNNQKYTYLYGVRSDKYNPEDFNYVQTKFQNKDTYTYRRPVNPADIAYINEPTTQSGMSVKVTYEIKVANLSSTLVTTIHSISNYFDSEYTMLNSSGWKITEEDGFNKAVYNGDLDITVNRGTEVLVTEVTYSVSSEAISNLLNEEATLNNAVEIESYSTTYGESTLYAEQRPKITDGNRTGKPYAGYDYDSHPGNANIQLATGEDGVIRLYSTDINTGEIIPVAQMEDDTDIAPSFVLCLDAPTTLSGTVFEDTNVKDNGERVGDGKYDSNNEKTVKNVKVELYEKNNDGNFEPATIYNEKGEKITNGSVQTTNDTGEYAFTGVVTGKEYYIQFIYGDDTSELTEPTKIIDNNNSDLPDINARNYKSTIITELTLIKIFKGTLNDMYWYISIDDNYSVAIDDMAKRLEISDLQYTTYDEEINMTAYSKPFITKLEFEATGTSKVETTEQEIESKEILGNIATSNNFSKLDFGIIERPREDLFTQKTISYIKLSLANGQVIFEGDPRTQDLNYVKAIGFEQEVKSGEDARLVNEKRLLAELDAELIQGAQLEVKYEVSVTNNNEIDYDYETNSDYYYYGTIPTGEDPLATTIELVDYLSGEVVYTEDTNQWEKIEESQLKTEGLISQETEKFVNENDYKVFLPKFEDGNSGEVTLERKEPSKILTMSITKVLTNQTTNAYDNGIEIIKIDGKTARTIQEIDGKIQGKKYRPGNYVPTQGPNEQDDDTVDVIITPPTGTTKYVATYIVTILAGLIVIITGIVFIKKKILTK